MKKVLIFLLIAAGLAGAWYLIKSRTATEAAAEEAKPAAKVEVTALANQEIEQTIEVFGVVGSTPSGDHVTSATYDVIVRNVLVSVGSTVAAGDVLLEVDPSPEAKLAAESARSVLAAANKTLAAAQERYDLKLTSSQDLLTAQQAAEDARLKAESLAARGMAGDGRIVAASAGVVSKIDVNSGALAPAGTALVTVTTGGQLEVRLGIEANDLGAVAAGQSVIIESSNRSESAKIYATIRTVGATLDPVTGAGEARATVPAGLSLLAGEHVRAEITLQSKDHALVVPRSAVLPDDEKHVLFTVKDGKAVKHEVALGFTTDELIEVIGGDLHEGDMVVTLGNYELEDGMAVQIAEKEDKKDGEEEEKDEKKPDDKEVKKDVAAKPTPEAKP